MRLQHKIGLMAFAVCTVVVDSVYARGDEAGEKLMREVVAKYRGLRTLSGIITTQEQMGELGEDVLQTTEAVELAKPNLARFVSKSLIFTEKGLRRVMRPNYTLVVSSGSRIWYYCQDRNTCTQWTVKADIFSLDPGTFLVTLFYAPDTFLSARDLIGTELVHEKAEAALKYRILGTQKIEGHTCRVLEQTLTIRRRPHDKPDLHITVFVIDADLLVRRIVRTIRPKKQWQDYQTENLTALRIDTPIPAGDFTFVPPAGTKLIKQSVVNFRISLSSPSFFRFCGLFTSSSVVRAGFTPLCEQLTAQERFVLTVVWPRWPEGD